MKFKSVPVVVILMACVFAFLPTIAFGASSSSGQQQLDKWDFRWEKPAELTKLPEQASAAGGWQGVTDDKPLYAPSEGTHSAWIRLKLPRLSDNSGAYLPNVFGQDVTVFLDGKVIFHSERNNSFVTNRIVLALDTLDSGKDMYIHVESKRERLGLGDGSRFGDYQTLMKAYAKQDLLDVIIGSAYICVAVVMLICAAFLVRQQLRSWLALCIVILSIGGLIIGNSPFLYTFYGQYGTVYQTLFDLSLSAFLTSLLFFFEQLFGCGYRRIVTHFRRLLIGYVLISTAMLIVNLTTDRSIANLYSEISVKYLGLFMIIQFILMFGMLIRQLWIRNIDSIIIATGLVLFTAVSITELLVYYSSDQTYTFFWWKWGLFAFVISLIVVLGRRFADQHKQIIAYSRELEIYYTELQRSEKLEIISQLAASVAHEVRNPLQVTRGMLQVLGQKNQSKPGEDDFYQLAIDELDRASVIVTDFLGFAKPQMENVVELNLAEEFKHVQGIIVPLANMQGGKLEIQMPKSLCIMGNSSKLKQAIINLIKNSIEALEGSGVVRVWAYEEKQEVVIHIADSGVGMDENMLERLGEPYLSSKSKGTGLGLMITIRIIEAMRGSINFTSEKGVGTEATIRFPSAGTFQQTSVGA
ncbi:sensor histidine kinase [Paenibacillus rhizovicinus]|uniref:histidine kinase n=1 Tax=Paenibacillus rhizovicinus TaxID=2704463 RepID=A0A6C0NUP5_9BACL|nr:sensor histidine kinase [Paenibacillus rhizovicinus]QHW29878.1 sensor histidine kinase [Paenibacillus rhizovicinus]